MTGSRGSSTKKENMFGKLAALNAKAADTETAAADPAGEVLNPSPALPLPEKQKPAPARKKAEPVKGKRDNPDYCQANSYILKAVRLEVERQLLDLKPLDFSTLVQQLLQTWLKSRGVSE